MIKRFTGCGCGMIKGSCMIFTFPGGKFMVLVIVKPNIKGGSNYPSNE
jgi:hypothetical protein